LVVGENMDLGPTAKGNKTNLQWESYYLNKTLHEQKLKTLLLNVVAHG
jgi:hypothetical protein